MSEEWAVKLEVNSKQIFLTPFVQKFLSSAILGMVLTLKDVPQNPKKISLTLEKSSR